MGLLEDRNSLWEKLRTAVTDVNRVRRKDPGNPEICNIYTIHKAFSENEMLVEIDRGCRSAAIGCIDCKTMLFKNLMEELTPIRERALSLKQDPDYVRDVIRTGAGKCSVIAKETMSETRRAIGLLT